MSEEAKQQNITRCNY